MLLFQKKSPYEKEWEDLCRKEERYLKNRITKEENILNQKLAEKVPEKLQGTLDIAFEKAFTLVFEKGTGVIEKTYDSEKLEKDYQVNHFANETKMSRKTLKAFSKKARFSGTKNLLLSGVSGIGMGVLGIGLPDIPLFTGMILKNIYEIAISYGYEYKSEKEQYFILLIIEGAMSYGEKIQVINHEVNCYMEEEKIPDEYQKELQIQKTAVALSKELLYMKFLQGIPIVGAIGGASDMLYMNHITEYANLKYKRRFLNRNRNINE